MQFLLPLTAFPFPTMMFLFPKTAFPEPTRMLLQPLSYSLRSSSQLATRSVAALMSADLSYLVPQVSLSRSCHLLRATCVLTRVIGLTGTPGRQMSAEAHKLTITSDSKMIDLTLFSVFKCISNILFQNVYSSQYLKYPLLKYQSLNIINHIRCCVILNCFKLIIMDEHTWMAPKEPAWIIKNNTFVKAVIESLQGDVVICMLEDGNYAQTKRDKVFQRNPAYNEFSSDKTDLMDNDLINQPEALKTLRLRLDNMKIYTFVENSIISVNPYYNIPMYYVDQVKEFYSENLIDLEQNSRDFQPHIYSITAQMLSNVKRSKMDQAVIISGQSGAGKTEANKQCLRFLQYYFHRSGCMLDKKIDSILTLSNPILQAFGNSKTIRNNNSSRFAVNSRLEVRKVKIFNYLLEKSRIINRADNQQNFHIFYQLLRGLSKAEKTNYYLSTSEYEYKMEDFAYLKSKNQLKYESHADISFQKVKMSLSTLQKPDAYDFVCRVLSAILLLGNLQLYQSENEDCCKISNETVFAQICELLKISRNTMNSALTCYQIKIGSDMLTKYFNGREVQELINSLAKILYQKLFQWIINQINSISCYEGNEQLNSLGFLDIYGFQILESNSLEQLFINYTNQRLHQIYLTKIFKEEEELFRVEGLTHMFKTIPYEDNMAVLQLIDFEQLSIFNLLDQWCQVASPDDSSFITKVRHKHKKHTKFPTQNFNLPSTMFLIKHSPKDIEYTVLGFRDKNKDLVRDEIKVALRSSQISHLRLLFTDSSQSVQVINKNNHKLRKFLSSKFRHEINSLITELLGKSELHFIRCIKSNSSKKALTMEDEVAYNQICYLGILDTIKLKKLGYCVKHSYQAIDARFKWLVRFYYTLQAFPKEITQSLKEFLPQFGQEDMLFGKTKIFFRDYAYSALVRKYRLYMQDMNRNTNKIQKAITSFIFRTKVAKTKHYGKSIKKYMKTFLLQKKYQQTVSNLIKLQRCIKIKLHKLREQKLLKNLYTVQAYIKKEICRRHKLTVFNAVSKIVSMIRRYKLRKNIQKLAIINKIKNIIVQKAWKKIVISHKNTLQTYFLSFKTQIQCRNLIALASLNTKRKYESRSVKVINSYLTGYLSARAYFHYMETLKRTQRFFRTFIYRSKYLKLRKAAIVIQRAYREYYFNKNTARELFEVNFGEEKYTLQNQNQSMRSFLYQNSLQNTLRILFLKFLDKFKEKCSLLYIIIDFEALINLELCYPDNSWLQNYFEVVKQSLQKDNPIQSIEVGQSFTVAATTNKLYLWGMNAEYNAYENMMMIRPQSQQRIEKIDVKDNRLRIYYDDRKEKQSQKECSTVNKNYHIQNGKLFETKASVMKLIKSPQINQRVVEIACGASHTIIRTSLKKVYTFGTGKQGQLGQGNILLVEQPKLLEFPDIKNYSPMQVTASINSSIILLSNRKIYWCGSNGTIEKVKVPVVFDLSTRFEQFSKGMFAPLRVRCSWSRSMSIIGVTLISFNGKLSNNIGLRNKVYELMVNKWQQSDFDSINPPFNPSFSDYLEQCHVKMPKTKQTIQPQSKRVYKKLQEKVSSIQTDKFNDISFSDPNFR